MLTSVVTTRRTNLSNVTVQVLSIGELLPVSVRSTGQPSDRFNIVK